MYKIGRYQKKTLLIAGFSKEYQYATPIDDQGNRIFFEFPATQSTLALPDDIEKETINRTLEENGEMLNYDKETPCNRIVMTNKNEDLNQLAVFTISKNPTTIKKAKALSEKLGIPFVEIDKEICRERCGLNPLTEKETKQKREGQSL